MQKKSNEFIDFFQKVFANSNNCSIFATPNEKMKNSLATIEEVNAFLKEFKDRAKLFGIVYVDSKPNNVDTLNELEITPKERDSYVLSLTTEDYSQGPDANDYPGQNDVWVFGKFIKRKELYIKIYINAFLNQPNVCISFHIAKHPMSYPLKKKD